MFIFFDHIKSYESKNEAISWENFEYHQITSFLSKSGELLSVAGYSTCARNHIAFSKNSWEGMEGQRKAIDSINEHAHI